MELKDHDNKLAHGLKAGYESSYKQLFNEYYLLLSAYANKYVNDPEKAREIVQDLFVHLFEIRHSLIITTSLKSYLYRSVKNRCLNQIRHIQLQETTLENIKTEGSFNTIEENKMMETELEYRIFQIVSELPVQCQRIFRMSRVDGKQNREIAQILNLSKRTVETQISKALKILRNNLQDYFKS
jgi:RNA polymerase sigma-70 factor (ECF subfamily)